MAAKVVVDRARTPPIIRPGFRSIGPPLHGSSMPAKYSISSLHAAKPSPCSRSTHSPTFCSRFSNILFEPRGPGRQQDLTRAAEESDERGLAERLAGGLRFRSTTGQTPYPNAWM